ncbi:MAG: tRNA lysidine(34) synthetase TilS [Elusimicrobiota bacterium]|jgi:tRNA(Ile)-lysidine synthase|nr:tRNA lysidine(34) synthetase TilS [Elusimicrobiota bacterium]
MQTLNFKAAVWQKLLAFDKKNCLFKTKAAALVGLSGGADSAALLHFAAHMARKKQFKLFACHVNHGLRKQAGRDAAFAQNLALKLGVPFILKNVNVKEVAKKYKLSAEHAARKARYAALEEAAKENKCAKIALAHHLDDHAETILLNLLRGTKAKGLLGIPVKRMLGKTEIIRPFLCITRAQILAYIKENKLDYIDDETNFEDIYTRNWVRLKLLPALESRQPQIRQHLFEISADLAKYIK